MSSESRYDVERVRRQFPALSGEERLIYFDSAATTLVPEPVIDSTVYYQERLGAQVHRGLYKICEETTELFEASRKSLLNLAGLPESEYFSVVTYGTTDSINTLASSLDDFIRKGDEILLTVAEHHANLLPWQRLAEKTGARLVFIDCEPDGVLRSWREYLSKKTRFISVTVASNVLGRIWPDEADLPSLVREARERGIPIHLDAAQAMAHGLFKPEEMAADFISFSTHKIYGPKGVGALLVRKESADLLKPFRLGGGMVATASFEGYEGLPMPHLMEAGTPNISGVVATGAGVEFFLKEVASSGGLEHEEKISKLAYEAISALKGIRVVGRSERVAGGPVLIFTVEGVHPHDIAASLADDGIAARAGHHCAAPYLKRLGVGAVVRASFGCYNTEDEVGRLAISLEKAISELKL